MIRRIWPISLLLSLLVLPTLTGCFGHESPSLTSHDPTLKIPAIKTAVQDRDPRAEGQLVKDLDSDDAAVRFYAIQGLQRLTGETFGYRYYDDEVQRLPALRRWQKWFAHQDGGQGQPATTQSTK